MCVKRLAADCRYNSFVTYQGESYYINYTEDDQLIKNETVNLAAENGSGSISVGFNEEVESHYISPVERRKIGQSPCERGLRKS